MTFRASVERYLGAVAQQYHRGDAREESYYDVLKQLWEELGSQLSSAHATLTVLPRQTEAGNPDMRVWSGQQHITGYIEAKEPGVTNLDHVEVSEQLKRYRTAFPNVILTNFLEFRLYRFGQPMGQPVTIGSLQAGMKVPFQHEDQFRELVERFFDFQLPRSYTAQTLAVALADRTRFLQQQVLAQLVDDEDHKRQRAGQPYGRVQASPDVRPDQRYLCRPLRADHYVWSIRGTHARDRHVHPRDCAQWHPGDHRHPAQTVQVHLHRRYSRTPARHHRRYR